jgi:surface antigen
MVSFSDERLIAYLDGELAPDLVRDIDQALARDSELRERVRQLRESGALIRRAFDAPVYQAVPARLLAAVERASPPEGQVVDLAARPSRGHFSRSAGSGMALAASIALCIGLVGGTQLGGLIGGGGASLDDSYALALGAVPDRILQAALDTKPSGVSISWRDQNGEVIGEIEPLLTFRDVDGRYCREYQVVAGAGSASALGLSCRQSDGPWRGVLTVAATAQPDGAYVPASRASNDALDATVDALMTGIPLSEAEETTLIANGWH